MLVGGGEVGGRGVLLVKRQPQLGLARGFVEKLGGDDTAAKALGAVGFHLSWGLARVDDGGHFCGKIW